MNQETNPMSLRAKRILVTGASSGIGRACAVLASRLGANAVLLARRTDALEETRSMMANPENHECVSWDLSDLNSYDALFGRLGKGGKFGGFVHAAGVSPVCPVTLLDTGAVRNAFDVNALSFACLMKYLAKTKFSDEGFSAVAVSSVSVLSGWPGGTVYAGTKGALSAMVRSLAMELVPKKFRVNAVSPSNIETPMFEKIAKMQDRESLEARLSKQPFGIGKPEQVASVVCFLLSGASSFITGTDIPVDGGYLAR